MKVAFIVHSNVAMPVVKPFLVKVITDALSGKVVDVQARKAFEIFHNI